MDEKLENRVHQARAWLAQMLGQLYETRPRTMRDDNPISSLTQVNALRDELAEAGYDVPQFANLHVDPLRNTQEWSQFLDRIAPTN